MTDRSRRGGLCAGLAMVLGALLALPAPARELALSIDDLPWAHHAEESPGDIDRSHAALLDALAAAGVVAVGFANPDQFEHANIGQQRGRRMLNDWLQAGHALGNHTWGHLDLHAVGSSAFKAGILAAEIELRPLVEAHGQNLRWFRHPYLRTGIDADQRAEVEAFLAARGYAIAPVSVDNSDWIYARAYQRLLAQTAAAEELAVFRRDYVSYLLDKLHYYEQQAQSLLGEAMPQVLLLHANRLNAEALPELLAQIREAGWRFVGIEQALAHSAYRRPDAYRGRFGPSWIHRWALAEGRPRDYFGTEPRVPETVMALAGVDSE